MLTAANAAAQKTLLSLVKGDVGLGNVDNTSDANKPVSTAQQTAIDLKANINSPTFTGTVGGITAAMVGAPSGSGTSSGTNTGDQTTISGNAGSSTVLATPRTINGVSFDGSANVTVTAAGSTLSDTVPVGKGGTGLIALGTALQVLRVNAGATALEYAAASGGVGGSTGATDNRVLRADGTGGATLQNSAVTIDDSGNVTGVAALTATGQITVPAGSAASPSLRISQPSGTTNNGFYSHTPPSVSLSVNDTPVMQWNNTVYVNLHSGINMGFSAGGNANNVNADVGLGRSAAGVLEINDCNTSGTKGTFRDLILRNLGVNGAISAGGGVGIVSIKNATTAPTTNPTGGGVLYCESGALKFRGSSGTVTTLGPA